MATSSRGMPNTMRVTTRDALCLIFIHCLVLTQSQAGRSDLNLLPILTSIKSLAKDWRGPLPSSFQGCFRSTAPTKTRHLQLSPSKAPIQQYGNSAQHL